MKDNWIEKLLPYKEITPKGGQFFFAYYDLKAINSNVHLTHRTSFIDRLQMTDDSIEIGYVPIDGGKFVKLDETKGRFAA